MNRYRLKYLLTKWFTWSEWRYQLKYRLWGFFQRGWRGWAPRDTWSLDWYLAKVLSGALTHLANNNHGCPMAFVTKYGNKRCCAQWKKWLLHKAWCFDFYVKDFNTDQYPMTGTKQQARRWHRKYDNYRKTFYEKELPDFCKHFSSLWN